ncbi:MAG: hypothetical protein WCF19_00615 [Chlamydiales bacterium]
MSVSVKHGLENPLTQVYLWPSDGVKDLYALCTFNPQEFEPEREHLEGMGLQYSSSAQSISRAHLLLKTRPIKVQTACILKVTCLALWTIADSMQKGNSPELTEQLQELWKNIPWQDTVPQNQP